MSAVWYRVNACRVSPSCPLNSHPGNKRRNYKKWFHAKNKTRRRKYFAGCLSFAPNFYVRYMSFFSLVLYKGQIFT
jgi:hypothetical protein